MNPNRNLEAAALLLGVVPEQLRLCLAALGNPAAAPGLVRRKDAARRLGIHIRTLDEWARQGRISPVRLAPAWPRRDGRMAGGVVAFRSADLDRIVEEGMVEERGDRT